MRCQEKNCFSPAAVTTKKSGTVRTVGKDRLLRTIAGEYGTFVDSDDWMEVIESAMEILNLELDRLLSDPLDSMHRSHQTEARIDLDRLLDENF